MDLGMRKGSFLTGFLTICTVPAMAYDNYSWNDHWAILGEFVYMKRSELANKTLVKDSKKEQSECPGACPDYTIIDGKDLINDFEFEPGYRVGVTYIEDAKNYFELNFLWLQEWHAEKEKQRHHRSYSFPFEDKHYTHDWHRANKAKATYRSKFWDIEANYWRNFTPRRVDYFSLSGIAGLRYFNLIEGFVLKMERRPDTSTYNIHTHNDVFGVQAGLDFCWNPTRWFTWETAGKVGGMANHSKQKTFLGDRDNKKELRDSKSLKWQLGIFTDVSTQFAFQFKDHLNLHVGYEMIYMSGLALAPEQVSKKTNSSAGKKDNTHGNIIIQGVFAGLTISF